MPTCQPASTTAEQLPQPHRTQQNPVRAVMRVLAPTLYSTIWLEVLADECLKKNRSRHRATTSQAVASAGIQRDKRNLLLLRPIGTMGVSRLACQRALIIHDGTASARNQCDALRRSMGVLTSNTRAVHLPFRHVFFKL
jgi:hypothetical protein